MSETLISHLFAVLDIPQVDVQAASLRLAHRHICRGICLRKERKSLFHVTRNRLWLHNDRFGNWTGLHREQKNFRLEKQQHRSSFGKRYHS